MSASGRWVKIGSASVDSGTLAVIDPCYVIGKGEEIYGWNDYDSLHEPYCDNLGVQFSSGFGDGAYEVWAWIVDMGDGFMGGERVAEVRVCLISACEDGDDDGDH